MDTEQPVEIMSTRDAAQCLGVSVRTVQLWVENGCLEAWKTPGGHRRIYRQSVNSMLSARSGRSAGGEFYEVLICEDDGHNCDQMQSQFKSLGPDLRLRVARNGLETLIQIGECCPNLLVVILESENTNGIQMLSALQNTAFAETMHIVVVTDLNHEVLKVLGGLRPGITRFSQPVAYPQLLRLVRIYMDISKDEEF